MRGAGAAVSGQAIDMKRWLCVAVALFSLILLPSLPIARANFAELVTTDDTAESQPVPVAFVTVDEDDDGMPTSAAGPLSAATAPSQGNELEWHTPAAAQVFRACLDPAPTVRGPPVGERS